ncbi:response regulator receiver domain-containing protein [Humitalea rosea]|uniref:Response regulator receiver domain-containing protein n=1 Tax=Humitalea rosea TaxID=990373 RepID=A0A2W7J574_9PROT|nr:response regulator [Humitalea rosea]PZW46826.1 response regulator receiver domain-containing protein [Humitalea rosea]
MAANGYIRGSIIVVVDDDPAVRDALQCLLEADGQTVRAYPSAAALLREGLPADAACLVLDQRMPGLSGLELAHEARLRGFRAGIILIAATADPWLRRRAMEAGIALVLEKPLTDDTLLPAVRRYVMAEGRAAPRGGCPPAE